MPRLTRIAAVAAALAAGSAQAQLETQKSIGAVTIVVTPKNVGAASPVWEFEVALDTHSQNLADDLTKSAVLVAGKAEQRPIAWKGPGPGGHHRSGILKFDAIRPYPQAIELRITRSGETAQRTFRWRLR